MSFYLKISLLFLLPLFTYAHNLSSNNEFINGIILDEKNREPIAFATVRIKGKALGVVSNVDGSFQIPLFLQSKGRELIISSMGYQTKTITFSGLEKNTINFIYLSQATVALEEIMVKAGKKRTPNSKQIIKYALQKIPINYQNNNFELIGYYRDYQLKEKKYLNLNEALIKVRDQGFAIDDYNKLEFGIIEYKKNFNFPTDSFAAKPYDYNKLDKFVPNGLIDSNYIGNELVLLFIHDAIRNHKTKAYSFVYQLVNDFIKEHRFSRAKKTFYDGQKVFQINFKKTQASIQVEGSIYIDKQTYAIRKLDYSVFRIKQDNDSIAKDLLYEILVEYQSFQNKMYLNYISFHNQFKLVRPPLFFVDSIVANPYRQTMKVFLNKGSSNLSKMNLNDFRLFYQGENIKLLKLQVSKDTTTNFLLNFSKKTSKQQELIELLFSKTKDVEKSSFY